MGTVLFSVVGTHVAVDGAYDADAVTFPQVLNRYPV